MADLYRYVFPLMWLSWVGYWLAAARNVKPTARREPLVSRLLHVLPLTLAAALLLPSRAPVAPLGERFLSGTWPFWLGALLTLAGLLFAVWARIHLGTNWSASIQVKQDHQLITSGPYRFVRHPIYSGLLMAFVGSALARADWRAVVAVVIALSAIWRKLSIEEQRMREQFGRAYDEYATRVPALLPFVR